jgi:POT family proton-dependent oligopeptide transporter
MPVSWVQSINPVFIIVLSGIFAAVWTKWGSKQPSTPMKFAVGTAVRGAAFLLFLPFAGGAANSTPLLAMIGILLVFTIAELRLSPVGLSVATKLAPAVFKTQLVALFFLSVALGSAVSGVLATWYATAPERLYFGVLGGIAIVLGLMPALIARPVLRLMGGVR